MLNAAIVGCGRIFTVHAKAIQKSNNAKLSLVVDLDEERAVNAAKEYECDYSTDFHSLLTRDDIDVVHICTPHDLHAQMAIDALKAGKDVLIEKPIAMNEEEGNEIIRTAKATGKQLGVCFQNRFNFTSQWVKEYIDSGQAGKILSARSFVTWFRGEEYYKSEVWRGTWAREGGGVLINQAIHTLDLIQWFLGEPDWLKANMDTRLLHEVIEVEDTVDATIGFKNGASVFFYATNNYTYNPPPLIELHGEHAIIRLEDDVTITYPNGEREKIENPNRATGEKSYWGQSHEKLVADFYRCIQNGERFSIDAEEGVKSLKLVNLIYESSKKNAFVQI